MTLFRISTMLVLYALAMTNLYAQDGGNNSENLDQTTLEADKALAEREKAEIIKEEKEALKRAIQRITQKLDAGEIDRETSDKLKQEAAQIHALNIEDRIAIMESKLALKERNGVGFDDLGTDKLEIGFFQVGGVVDFRYTPKKRKYDRRTTSDFVLAVGFNNVITEGQSLADSDYKVAGSRFAELGWAWKTRVFDDSNWLRIKYGFSFQFNGLKATDNRYLVDTGAQTELQTFPLDLDKSKFRLDNLVFPVHFEFGPSNKVEGKDYFRYNTHKKIKIGVGGYAGFNLSSRQKLKFSEDGQDVKQKLKANYNVNSFVYGLSTYVGWRGTALYLKYDLNPIFKDNPIEQRNVSLGLRFDMD